MWTVWNQRNTCVFYKVNPHWGEVKELIKTRVAFRGGNKDGWQDCSIEDFLFRFKCILDSI